MAKNLDEIGKYALSIKMVLYHGENPIIRCSEVLQFENEDKMYHELASEYYKQQLPEIMVGTLVAYVKEKFPEANIEAYLSNVNMGFECDVIEVKE